MRVFVSSVVDGFNTMREAARQGIQDAGGQPVLVNEDFPSLAGSSRNACLDAIDSCDCVVTIVGSRGGWTTPSGRLVVEEEFEHARRRNIPVIAFVEDTPRDQEAEKLLVLLSDYIDGRFRTTFRHPEDLRDQVARAVRARAESSLPMSTTDKDLRSHFGYSRHNTAGPVLLRFVLAPERDEEVVDPLRIKSTEFREDIYRIGHTSQVKLFSFERPKSAELVRSTLTIEQSDGTSRAETTEHVKLQISETGVLVIDNNATGRVRRGGMTSMVDALVIALEDVEVVLNASFLFASAFYDLVDPYMRYERFLFNVGLLGMGYRSLERNPQSRSQMGMSMRTQDSVVAYEGSRIISRQLLRKPREEIDRAVALIERKAGE